MTHDNSSDTYWFDAAPLATAPRRRSVLKKVQSLRVGGNLSPEQEAVLAAFAEANGLDHRAWVEQGGRDIPSVVLGGSLEAVVSWPEEPQVQFGNHGWRYAAGAGFTPARRGYVAVRHGLPLAHGVLEGHVVSARNPLNVVSDALEWVAVRESSPTNRSMDGFKRRAGLIDLREHEGLGFRAYGARGQESEVRDLILAEDALPLLTGLADSFDIEFRDSWLLVYSYFGDISTLDPDVWAWAFSVASRMLDLVEVWAGSMPSRQGAPEGAVRGHDLPFYTSRHIERPSKLEGSLKLPKRST